MRARTIVISVAVLAATLTVASASAHGREGGQEEGHDHDRGRRSSSSRQAATAIDPLYVKECGSCHLPYPPGLLPADSWRRIMAGLGSHFGQDAELEPEASAAIEGWLVARGAPARRSGEAPLRITELGWFRHEHEEVPRNAAARPSIRSMANCAACHPGASQWDFDEDRVRIPR